MPTAALKRCRGCTALVSSGWCKQCQPDRRRFQKGATGYNMARWIRLRDRFRVQYPRCVNAETEPRCTLLTDVVDHKIPHRGNEHLMYDESNLQPLCWSCHGRKTAREVGFAGHRGE